MTHTTTNFLKSPFHGPFSEAFVLVAFGLGGSREDRRPYLYSKKYLETDIFGGYLASRDFSTNTN